MTTPTVSNIKKSYGSTEPTLTRNEVSVGGGTAITNETEPLLGEKWLDDRASTPASKADDVNNKPFYTDASTIDVDDSVIDDPHIGINVVTNDYNLDSMSYSRDDSTLGLGDRYFRTPKNGSRLTMEGLVEEEDDRKRRGFFLNALPNNSRGKNPTQVYFLVCFGLSVGIALCAVAALMYIEYWHYHGVDVLSGAVNDTDDTTVDPQSSNGMPFAKVARKSFGDPVSSIFDVSLFDPSMLHRGSVKRAIQHEIVAEPFFKFPFPTGAFWTNLVLLPVVVTQKQQTNRKLGSSTNPNHSKTENQYSYPIVAYPYSFQWSSAGILQASYSVARRQTTTLSIQDPFGPDISFGSVQDISARYVRYFDSLSVTLRFDADSTGKSYWESYIVQGSPYITARYYGLTPQLTALSDFKDIACPPTMDQLKVNLSAPSNSTKRRLTSASVTGTDTSKMLGICDVSDESTEHSKIITGVQFILTTNEGLTWLVFTSDPITFLFDKNARHQIAAQDLFDGVIRVALVPPDVAANSDQSTVSNSSDTINLASSPGVKRLIYHADTYPVGGSVQWNFRSGTRNPLASSFSKSAGISPDNTNSKPSSASKDSNIGTITFQFDVEHMTETLSSKVSLLSLALPHHAASISSAEEMLYSSKEFDLNYYCIKGKMTPVTGNSWSYEEELTSIAFGDEPIAKPSPASTTHQTISELTAVASLDQSILDLILDTVSKDAKINLPDNNSGAYSFGKQIARLAQLAHIAEKIESENSSTSTTSKNNTSTDKSARKIYALLQMYLTMWLTGDDGSIGSLVYDASLGGILSKEGMKDPYSDFGNGRYNDHHFHYGYVLYAAALMGRRNPQFVSQYGHHIDAIFFDVTYNTADIIGKKDQAYFPFARHKSWFDGHSFASGLFSFADGKSQESSSEATNCYYGAYLWAKVRWGNTADGTKLVNFARLLLATEMTGTKTYWHMVPSISISSSGARRLSNSTTVVNTWRPPPAYDSIFAQNYMVGNLGMTDATCTTWFGTENIYVYLINFMPVTAITTELFDKAYVSEEIKGLGKVGAVDNSWKGYVICHKAILDPNMAWTEAIDLISNQLDPGLSKGQVLYWISTRGGFSQSLSEVTPSSTDDSDDTSTSDNDTDDASFDYVRNSTSKSDIEGSSCESHPSCSALNLSGQCCPTDEGVMLGCCS